MGSALEKAIELILSGNAELADILLVTARMTLPSSLIALAIGVPLGVLLGSCVFPGRRFLTVLNRTMTGMPPVVCGLIFYLLFSGVGPFRSARILFTVRIMVLAQIVLITPIVAGCMESFLADISPGILETGRGLASYQREPVSDRQRLPARFLKIDRGGWRCFHGRRGDFLEDQRYVDGDHGIYEQG